ncbi:MAG: hypothetical protein WDA09_00660 [Bacteriovoracaceae bacterium]
MINSKLGNNNFLILAAAIFFIVAVSLHLKFSRPVFDIEMQDRALNIDQDLLKALSIGNKRTISNVLWVQTLMESDAQHYTGQDRKNWMYLRFSTIAELDPLFYHNYLWGGMYLSIIKNDMLSASEIFDRGIVQYPDDYELNYHQGFNYYFELGEFEKGLEYLNKIAEHPRTPLSIKLIINKLRFETSANYDFALNYLWSNIQKEKDEVLLTKLIADFYALKAERDLNCLNNNGTNCDYRDADGNSYLKTRDGWKAPKDFKPYRIHLPKRNQ